MVAEQDLRPVAEIPRAWTAEDGHNGALHFPLDAPGHRQQLSQSGDFRRDPVLQRQKLLQRYNVVFY